MAQVLRQSTAVDLLIGPFVDEDDGKTLEGALTISQGDVLLSKNGQALAQKNDATACAFDAVGCYNCELDATDTNTVGQLTVIVFEDGALPFRRDYQVIEAAVYDALYADGATGLLPANLTQVNGAAQTATLDTIKAETAVIVTDTTTDIPALIATLQAFVDTEIAAIVAAVITNAAGVDIAADIIALKAETALIVADTNELQVDDTPGALAALDTLIDSIIAAVITNAAGTDVAADIIALKTVADTIATDTTTDLPATLAAIQARLKGLVIHEGTIGSTGNDAEHLHLDGLTYGNDEINGYLLVVFDASESEYHHREITDWVLATELATVATLPFTPENAVDTYWLLGTLGSASLTGGDATEAKQDAIIALLPTALSTGGFMKADVEAWKDGTVVVVNTTGVPKVDVVQFLGGGQTVTDLKHFADTGYDPATSKVAGVVLADAVTVVNGLAADVITATSIQDGALAAAKFAAGAFDAVWSVAARLLTAGTNIVLAKGVGVTGFNDLSAAQVNAEADTALADYDGPTNAELTAAQAAVIDGVLDGVRVSKNTALAGFTFFMRDSADGGTGKTGLTITATRSLDGAAFGACANAASEISAGWYTIDLAAADLNANVIGLNFDGGAGAFPAAFTVITQPKD